MPYTDASQTRCEVPYVVDDKFMFRMRTGSMVHAASFDPVVIHESNPRMFVSSRVQPTVG